MDLKIQLITSEIFEWGIYGGYGNHTRRLGQELVKRGVDVEVVISRGTPQFPPVDTVTDLDGMKVKVVPCRITRVLHKRMYETDADIIHSECSPYDTTLSFTYNPKPKKMITVQDIRTPEEIRTIGADEYPIGKGTKRILYEWAFEQGYRYWMHHADLVTAQAELLKPKMQEIYGVKPWKVLTIPNFIDVPKGNMEKSPNPTVAWIGRLDPIKHFEYCIEMARRLPHVEFYALGKGHKPELDMQYRKTVMQEQSNGRLLNLHMVGFADDVLKHEILSKSWVLLNTSVYEALPVTFLEAIAHKNAICAFVDPDHYASMFGAQSYNVDDMERALKYLMNGDRWKQKGESGYAHALRFHDTPKCIDSHLSIYRGLLDNDA